MLDMTDGRKRKSADYTGKRTIYPTKGSRRISPREFANLRAKRFEKVAREPGKKYRLPKVNIADKSSLDTLAFSKKNPSPNSRSRMLDISGGRAAHTDRALKISSTKGSRRISPREFANSRAKRFKKIALNPGKRYRLPKVNIAGKSSLDTLAFSNRKTSPNSRSRLLDISGGRAASTSGKTRTIYSKKESRQISPRKFSNTKLRKIDYRNLKVSKKHYKVLKNGTVDNDTLTKRKERVIYNQQPTKKLRKIKPQKITKSRLKLLKAINKQQKKAFRKKAELITIAMGGVVPAKTDFSKYGKFASSVKTAANIATKPEELMKKCLTAQTDNSDDIGVQASNLSIQTYDHGTRGIKSAVNSGIKTAKKGAKLTKQVYRKIHKPTSAELRRKLRKRVNHNIVAEAKYLAKRAVKRGTAKAGKVAAKAATKAAKATAKATAKAVQAAVKATTSAVSKIASLIAQTAPWSLIIIAALALIIAIILLIESLFTSAGGTLVGGAGWVMGDESKPTPSAKDAYNNYKEYMDDIDNILENEIIQTLKNSVTGFCADDPTPKKIISYKSKAISSGRLYPAYKQDRTINGYIDKFELKDEDYVEMLSALFVLMTREKQQAENVGENEIFEFIFKTEDISEFIGSVNDNTSRWGDTFFIKTDVNESPVSCPGEDCKIKYKDDDCASYTDDDGHKQYYCKGHPYCPVNHTEKKVSLYKVTDYYNKTVEEIYNFSEAEKTRYNLSKTIISMLIEEYGSETSSEAEGA